MGDWYPSLEMKRNKVFVQGLRPDLLIRAKGGVVILEVDEHCHSNRELYPEEAERMFRMWEGTRTRMAFVRFNPDAFHNVQGNAVRVSEDIRLDRLRKVLDTYLAPNFKFPPKPSLTFLFYEEHLKEEVTRGFNALIQ